MFGFKRAYLAIVLCASTSLSVVVSSPAPEVHQHVFERSRDGACSLVYRRKLHQFRLLTSLDDAVVQARPSYHSGGLHAQAKEHLFVYGYTLEAMNNELVKHCASISSAPDQSSNPRPELVVQGEGFYNSLPDTQTQPPPPMFPDPPSMEVTPLHTSGRSQNRVDFVFFGDGYATEEKDKFLSDAKRLAQDIITNQTFATVNPLLNIWAAFSPSKESGIGIGGKPKDTVYGLYRDGTELRAVYAQNELLVHAACLKLMSQCDYPILLGNDPLYGGLGGLATITTSSQENGALVLRHELGHSVILVGEEYDGGTEYSGVNADSGLGEGVGIKWNRWLSEPDKPARAERSVMPLQGYPWTMLNHSYPFIAKFTSSGDFSRHLVRFSLSGLPSSDDLEVRLDGKNLGWKPKNGIGIDRWHYDIYHDDPLSGGEHSLEFALQSPGNASIAQLCSFEVLEFGDETEFNTTFGHISAFPTYSVDNRTTYRPTNEQCLMRIVTSPNFCSPCIEGLWRSLFTRVNLVDGFGGNGCHKPDDNSEQYHRNITLNLLPLAQFRQDSLGRDVALKESFNITWSRLEDGKVIPEFQNSATFFINDSDTRTWFQVDVEFHTDEVRSDPDRLLTSRWFFMVFIPCKDQMESKIYVTQDVRQLNG